MRILRPLIALLVVAAASAADTDVLVSQDSVVTTGGAPPDLRIAVVDENHPTLALGPDPTVVCDEADRFFVAVTATSPSGGVGLDVGGIPAATWVPANGEWYWYPGYSDAGTYVGTITAHDAAGRTATATLTLIVRNTWAAAEFNELRVTTDPPQTSPTPTVRGATAFRLTACDVYGVPHQIPAGFSYTYLLDDRPIGSVTSGDVSTTLDLSGVADGAHVLRAQPLDGTDLDSYRPMPLEIVVDNAPGAVVGAQPVPLLGFYLHGHYDPAIADWIAFPGGGRPLTNPTPLPYRASVSAATAGDATALLADSAWLAEPLVHALSGLYQANQGFYRTADGDIVSRPFYPIAGSTSEASVDRVVRFDDIDGPRDVASVSPYITLVPDPRGTGWVGVEIGGSLRQIASDGTVTTLAGWQRRSDVVPYTYDDATVPLDAVRRDDERLLGDFAGGTPLVMPIDLAFDPRDATGGTIYVADTGNRRIAKVVLGATPTITTVVGQVGIQGYRDGAAADALFAAPYSIAFAPDGTLFIADLDNSAIRMLSADGTTVTTIAGGRLGPAEPPKPTVESSPDAYLVDGDVATAMVNYPQVLRLDSHGDVVFGEHLTGCVRRFVRATNRVETIHVLGSRDPGWVWLDVDRRGNVGPVDDVIATMGTGGGGNTEVWRLSRDGTRAGRLFNGGGTIFHHGRCDLAMEPCGHYPWAIAIDDVEARFVTTGFGTSGVASFRRFLPGDAPAAWDYNVGMRGNGIWRSGTAPGFPIGARPAFTAVHGANGHSRLGCVPDVDELGTWSDADLAAYVQRGMGGSVPRPELTGNDLAAVMYHIRCCSLRSIQSAVAVPTPDPDTTPPAISGIQVAQVGPRAARVSWTTDEPTLGLVHWGMTAAYHAWSDLESGYGTAHSVVIPLLPTGEAIHYAIRAKDVAGNQTVTADAVVALDASAGAGAPTPAAISDLAVAALSDTSIRVTWTTDVPSTSRVDYGYTDQYGATTPLDTALVTSHAVTIAGLLPATTYHLRAQSTASAEPPPDTTPPTAPIGVRLGDATATGLTLRWNASSDDVGVAGYRIDVATDAAFTAPVTGLRDLDVGSATSRALTGLTASRAYWARVRAYDAAGNLSAWSASATASTAGDGTTAPAESGSGGGGGHRGCGLGGGAAFALVLALGLRRRATP